MSRFGRILFAFCLVLAPLLPTGVALAWQGVVIDVSDGDTLVVRHNGRRVKVRLAGIDAPEIGQPWASEAKRALSSLVANRRVSVDAETKDRYGRTVGHVSVAGRDVGEALIRAGHAWHFREYSRSTWLAALEARARAEGLGLWSASREPVPPWDWRADRRAAAKAVPRRKPLEETTIASACTSKRLCSQMRSCAEARAQMRACGLRHLDSDGDGVPCESLCRR